MSSLETIFFSLRSDHIHRDGVGMSHEPIDSPVQGGLSGGGKMEWTKKKRKSNLWRGKRREEKGRENDSAGRDAGMLERFISIALKKYADCCLYCFLRTKLRIKLSDQTDDV